MSRFLFVMCEAGGNVPPVLGVARRLVERGHQVRVLGDRSLARDATAAGCAHVPFKHAPHHAMRDRDADTIKDYSAATPLGQIKRVAQQLLFGPASLHARDVVEELARAPADAVAVDCLLFGALVGAEASGLPTAALCHFPYSVPTPGLPPFGMGLRPARGVLGRLRDRVLGGMSSRFFERLGRAPVNAARAEHGLPPIASVFEQLLASTRVLVLTSKQFDFAGALALPDNVVYAGPQLDDPAWVAPWTPPWPADAREPLVLVALGSTFQAQRPTLQRVVDALGTLPVRGLVTLGDVFDPSELVAPPNVTIVGSAPHAKVLPLTSVAIAHGGHGTVMKALGHGVPVLCMPLGRDQADNGARVAAAGAGLVLSRRASSRAIARAVRRLLDDAAFAAASRRLADEIAGYATMQPAIVELEQLATSQSSKRREAI